ncbi:MAG: nuclear transport factor 2 family protein [Sneathiellales bacterium]|nr:nuclear transport factor 2 family protein [Sneathiellales bacterium]
MIEKTIENWHRLLENKDVAGLDSLLHDDATFHSPVVHTPQQGKQMTTLYLAAAFNVLASDKFHYVREVLGERDAILEFQTEINGITINGVDMISCDENGLITDFKVMVRPLKAINLLHQMMAEMLGKISKAS